MAGNVRNLDDALVARLRAARHGRSTEAEHRETLRGLVAALLNPFEELAADLRKLTKDRQQTSSEFLLREGRGER